jgi:hypothetical protein
MTRATITPEEYRALVGDDPAEPTRNKYNARRVKADGHTFDSQAEYRRYKELLLLQAAGEIKNLYVHPRYPLQPAFVDNDGTRYRSIHYTADFLYRDIPTGRWVVEDVKSAATAKSEAFRLRWRLFRRMHRSVWGVIVEQGKSWK